MDRTGLTAPLLGLQVNRFGNVCCQLFPSAGHQIHTYTKEEGFEGESTYCCGWHVMACLNTQGTCSISYFQLLQSETKAPSSEVTVVFDGGGGLCRPHVPVSRVVEKFYFFYCRHPIVKPAETFRGTSNRPVKVTDLAIVEC